MGEFQKNESLQDLVGHLQSKNYLKDMALDLAARKEAHKVSVLQLSQHKLRDLQTIDAEVGRDPVEVSLPVTQFSRTVTASQIPCAFCTDSALNFGCW